MEHTSDSSQELISQGQSGQGVQQDNQQTTFSGRVVGLESASDHSTAQPVDWQAAFDRLLGTVRPTASTGHCSPSSAPIHRQASSFPASFTMDQAKSSESIDRTTRAPRIRPRHAPPLPGYDKIIRTDPVSTSPSDPSPFARLAPTAPYKPTSQMSATKFGTYRSALDGTYPELNSFSAAPPTTPASVSGAKPTAQVFGAAPGTSNGGVGANARKRINTSGNAGVNLTGNKKPRLDSTEPSPRHALPSETTKFTQFAPKLTVPGSGMSTLHSRPPWLDRPTEYGRTFSFTANSTAPSPSVGGGLSTPPLRPWWRPTESGNTVTPSLSAPSSSLPPPTPPAVPTLSAGAGNCGATTAIPAHLTDPAQQAISVPDQVKKLEAEMKGPGKGPGKKAKKKGKDDSNNAAMPQRLEKAQNIQAGACTIASLQAPIHPIASGPASQALVPLENASNMMPPRQSAPADIETGEDAYARRVRMATMSSGHTGGNTSGTAPAFAISSDGMRQLQLTSFQPLHGTSALTHITNNIVLDVSVELQLEGSMMSDFTDLSACNSVQAFFLKIQDALKDQLMGRDIARVCVWFTNDIHERQVSIPRDNHHAFDAMVRVVAAQAPKHKLYMVAQVVPEMPLALGAPT